MTFHRIVLTNRDHTPPMKLLTNFSHSERGEICTKLGVANVASVQLAELTDATKTAKAGALVAVFTGGEGLVLHIEGESLDLGSTPPPAPPPAAAPPAPSSAQLAELGADVAELTEQLVDLRAESSQRLAVIEDLTRQLDEANASVKFSETARVEAVLKADELKHAARDLEALKARVETERKAHADEVAALRSKLDRLDLKALDAEKSEVAPNDA